MQRRRNIEEAPRRGAAHVVAPARALAIAACRADVNVEPRREPEILRDGEVTATAAVTSPSRRISGSR